MDAPAVRPAPSMENAVPGDAGRAPAASTAVPAFDGSASRPRLAPGRHRLVDPDGRTVEVTAVGRTGSGSGSAQG
ncbi:hypothetical protein [Streptomyces sp. NBC_01264]|uniref:hypothetical protein n=1 Tax=Streptomyces sp. NBC_01264 TaxID=2903804 RepID=UPI00224D06BE|nr:hypothetical protein [Streptomyces sp. NBC_01264]MCX4776480.1 hypothetical protein [Streptomyces sp. NBC_01264]